MEVSGQIYSSLPLPPEPIFAVGCVRPFWARAFHSRKTLPDLYWFKPVVFNLGYAYSLGYAITSYFIQN
jgi:hypothetical protein